MTDKPADNGSKSRFGNLFSRKKNQEEVTSDAVAEPNQESSEAIDNAPDTDSNIEQGLDKTRNSFFSKLGDLFKGTFDLSDQLFAELEETLIASDMGVDASLTLVDQLQERVINEKIGDAKGVIRGLQAEMADMLRQAESDWQFQQRPYVILMVGVNGVGKTTTTAKIAQKLKSQGKSVMLAAADTFRAAAVEQLQSWGDKLDIPVIAQQSGSDAAAVAHDAYSAALARNIDVLLIDTAGRLHTQSDLMEQLQKVNRVLAKLDPEAPHEVMQILDATTGQNALNQLEHFQRSVNVNSLCLTKLDGSARGGVAISLTKKFGLPIRFIGIGEKFSDLKPFNADEYAEAILPRSLI